MLVFNTMLLKGNSENGTFSVAVFGVIYTMSTIPGAMFDGAGAAAGAAGAAFAAGAGAAPPAVSSTVTS